MQTDKISVVVPCWNYAMFLRECLDSLLEQSVRPAKVIIADDASTDSTPSIAQEYCDNYPEIFVYMRNEQNMGTIGNENKAAAMVESPWMFFLDADDKIDAQYIEKVLRVIEAHDDKLFVVYSDMRKFGLWEGDWIVSDWNREALRTGNYINGHSVFRRDLFERIGGLKENGHFEDHWMWCEMMDLDPAFYGVRIPELLVWYRRHDYGHRTDKSDVNKRQGMR